MSVFCVAVIQRGRVSPVSEAIRDSIFDAIGDAQELWRTVGGNLDPVQPFPGASTVIAEYKGKTVNKGDLLRCHPLRRVQTDRFDCIYAEVEGEISFLPLLRKAEEGDNG